MNSAEIPNADPKIWSLVGLSSSQPSCSLRHPVLPWLGQPAWWDGLGLEWVISEICSKLTGSVFP